MLRIAPLTATSLAVLAALNAWLLAVVIEGPVTGETMAGATAEWTPNVPQSGALLPKLKPPSAYTQTLARPIFFKSREPYVRPTPAPTPVPKAVVAPPPVLADPGLALGGIMITDDARKAYVFNKADSRGTCLSEGETILG
jgi:hypothetical protein